MSRGKWLLSCVLLWLSISAPTPGSVGACNGDNLDQPADLASYCRQREELICVRRFLRKEITAQERDACRWTGIDECARRTFARDCQPTRRQTGACINALSSLDTLHIPEADLAECNTQALCSSAAPRATTDAGASSP